jgi:hypothetical protein
MKIKFKNNLSYEFRANQDTLHSASCSPTSDARILSDNIILNKFALKFKRGIVDFFERLSDRN